MPDPDHHWPLAENLNDVVGELHGTNNGVTFEEDGVKGPVAYFEGESAYANLPSFVNGLTEISIACWFRMDEERVWSRIYSFGTGDQSEPKDVLMVIPASGAQQPDTDPPHQMYRFTLSNPGGAWYDIDFPMEIVNVELNTWYHSIVVLKPDSIILYHDGVQIFAESGFDRPFGTIEDNENALGKSFWPDPLWKGALSDLRVYKTGLSDSQAIALYNETKPTSIKRNDIEDNAPIMYSDHGKIYIKVDQPSYDEVVTVFNITGAMVAQKPLSEMNSLTFDTGIYIVRLQGSRINHAAKVFVK
jgi:hypothetical protein